MNCENFYMIRADASGVILIRSFETPTVASRGNGANKLAIFGLPGRVHPVRGESNPITEFGSLGPLMDGRAKIKPARCGFLGSRR